MKIIQVTSKRSELDPKQNPFLNKGVTNNIYIGFEEKNDERGITLSMSSGEVYPVTLRTFIPRFRVIEVIELNPNLG